MESTLLRMTGWNCTTLSLSPTRTSIEFGLAGISCFPRVNQTLQWTWIIALLTRIQDVVCLLPPFSKWNLPDTVVPAIEKSQNNIVLNLSCMVCIYLHNSRMSDITDSTTVSLMHCTLSLTVCKCTPCQRASFNSTTDSFSWGHDPYTLACKARPSPDRCWTSLSVSLSLSLSLQALCW